MKSLLFLIAILLAGLSSSASHSTETGAGARPSLDGVAGFVEGSFASTLKETLKSVATAWTAGAISSS
ncbi:MAG TPA: hypothetical protein PLY45_04720, partial [bacterium]|nr:hypothetical protein [bacterium]